MATPLRRLLAGLVAVGLLVSGCSSSGAGSEQPQPASTSSASSSSPVSGTPAVATENAEEVFEQIAAQVPTARLVKVYTEDDDPNRLLGRPNGYTSKIAFSDSRVAKSDTQGMDKDAVERGGSIEVFPDAGLAEGRSAYIQSVLKNGGLGAEYGYVRGPVLLRVTGNLSPSKAKDYEAALG